MAKAKKNQTRNHQRSLFVKVSNFSVECLRIWCCILIRWKNIRWEHKPSQERFKNRRYTCTLCCKVKKTQRQVIMNCIHSQARTKFSNLVSRKWCLTQGCNCPAKWSVKYISSRVRSGQQWLQSTCCDGAEDDPALYCTVCISFSRLLLFLCLMALHLEPGGQSQTRLCSSLA